MNVSLPSELEKFVHKEVASKRYQTASEVVRHALRLMQTSEEYDKARLEALRQDIQMGVDQLDRGEFVEGKDLTLERIRKLAIREFGPLPKRKRKS